MLGTSTVRLGPTGDFLEARDLELYFLHNTVISVLANHQAAIDRV